MDTRFWGPPGWDLLHRIAFHSKHPHKLLANISEILPCKFCRESTSLYVKLEPYTPKDPGRWLYNIHNRVNHKLRSQCHNDPKVVNPGPDPKFNEVVEKFKNKTLTGVHGGDFLLSIAVNFTPTPKRTAIQKRFFKNLAEAYPLFEEYYKQHPPVFSDYAKWMHKFTGGSIEKVESYKSLCKHGKTCRRLKGGRRRITRRRLLLRK